MRSERNAESERTSNLAHHFPLGVDFYHKTGTTSDSTSNVGWRTVKGTHAVIVVGLQEVPSFVPGSLPGGRALLQRIGQGIHKGLIRPLRRSLP